MATATLTDTKSPQTMGEKFPSSQTLPPYTSTAPETKGNLPPSYDKSAYPPLPHHTQAPSRTLHVWFESWLKSDVHILDADHSTLLYTVNLKLRKPQIALYAASSQKEVGRVNFSIWSCTFDSTIHGVQVPIKSRGVLKNGYYYESNAIKGATFTWKWTSKMKLVCEDGDGITVACYSWPGMSMRKGGRFDFFRPEVVRDEVLEEILLTGLAVVQYNAQIAQVSLSS